MSTKISPLSTAKKVAPAVVENLVKEHHRVGQAYVHVEGRSYPVALITLDPAEAVEYARRCALKGPAYFLSRPRLLFNGSAPGGSSCARQRYQLATVRKGRQRSP